VITAEAIGQIVVANPRVVPAAIAEYVKTIPRIGQLSDRVKNYFHFSLQRMFLLCSIGAYGQHYFSIVDKFVCLHDSDIARSTKPPHPPPQQRRRYEIL
jgi:hypothetical protein